jgi:hypothetical protein
VVGQIDSVPYYVCRKKKIAGGPEKAKPPKDEVDQEAIMDRGLAASQGKARASQIEATALGGNRFMLLMEEGLRGDVHDQSTSLSSLSKTNQPGMPEVREDTEADQSPLEKARGTFPKKCKIPWRGCGVNSLARQKSPVGNPVGICKIQKPSNRPFSLSNPISLNYLMSHHVAWTRQYPAVNIIISLPQMQGYQCEP